MAEVNEQNAQDLPDDAGPPVWWIEPGVSRLAPRWWIKTLAFAAFLIGFGAWGLYDALVAYPERGIADAEYKELEYLRAWSSAAVRAEATVADPKAEFDRLEELARRQAGSLPALEGQRLAWLSSLKRVARLSPEHTRIETPLQRLQELETSWVTRTRPKPLSAYDIPAQWLFVAVGFTIGPWLLFKFVTVLGKKYAWNPVGQRLTIPGGHELTPEDLADVDKRKWDKFIVFLKVKDAHPKLAGQEVKVDLYHYTQPVEDWVMAMEATAFPDRAREEEDADADRSDADDDEGGGGDGDD